MTTYKVQLENETNLTTTSKATAERRARDLAAAGYNGRIVTGTGRVVNEWTVTPSVHSEQDKHLSSLAE